MRGKLSSQKSTEKLIELVKNYPELYNQRSSSYPDSDFTLNVWKSIAKALEEDVSGIYHLYSFTDRMMICTLYLLKFTLVLHN
jgi:hypothetical protein